MNSWYRNLIIRDPNPTMDTMEIFDSNYQTYDNESKFPPQWCNCNIVHLILDIDDGPLKIGKLRMLHLN